MCGRYAAAAKSDDLIEQLEIDLDRTREPVRSVLVAPQSPPAGEPDYNVSPAKNARVVLASRRVVDAAGAESSLDSTDHRPTSPGAGESEPDGTVAPVRTLCMLTWGLVPPWSKDPRSGVKMINARAETVMQRPAFRRAAASRRALVPADGWFEWQVSPTVTDAKGKPRKQPFFMHRPDGVPLTFAGLYEFWRDPECAQQDPMRWLTTFTIITTRADPGLDRIHDRQPLVLDPEHWSDWLNPDSDADLVSAALQVARPGRFAAYPVDRGVGNSRANGPQLLSPLGRADLHGVVDPATGEVLD